MIPVTLAFFSHQAEGSARRTVLLACCYVLGIALSYALLGAVAANTGALLGSWLQQPLVLAGVTALLVALSLSMFGLYELRVPSGIIARLGRASSGPSGALLMGLAIGLVAAPCIGPFVLGLMLVVSRMANPGAGFLLFFVLGLGMGLPYIFLGLAAHRARQLPKAGAWLIWSKKLLGVVLLGVALYYSRSLLPGWLVTVLAAGLLIGAGVYLGWLEPTPADRAWFRWLRWVTGASLIAAAAAGLIPHPAAGPGVAWQPFTAAALADAAQAGQPVIVDIYADWCLPCVEMDHVTFRHPDVVQALAAFATLRVDATREISPDGEALLAKHRVYGVPTVLFFDRAGREQPDIRLAGFETPAEFLKRLRALQ